MMRKLSIVLGSLVGALAIHGALIACSSGGTSVYGQSSEGTAHADPATTGAACAQWEVKTVAPTKYGTEIVHYTDTKGEPQQAHLPSVGVMTIEAGWEPIGTVLYSPLLRHCIK